jgi:hypothetical protein
MTTVPITITGLAKGSTIVKIVYDGEFGNPNAKAEIEVIVN